MLLMIRKSQILSWFVFGERFETFIIPETSKEHYFLLFSWLGRIYVFTSYTEGEGGRIKGEKEQKMRMGRVKHRPQGQFKMRWRGYNKVVGDRMRW